MTPSALRASARGVFPFMGRLATSPGVIDSPADAVMALTSGDSDVTVIDSLELPTSSRMSSAMRSLVPSSIPECRYFLNPATSTVT